MAKKKAVVYRIHPAIGVARVGGGASYFIGPEVPGYGPTGSDAGRGSSVPKFKEAAGVLKRQAARFRVWRYTWDDKQHKYVPDATDLTLGAVKSIKWTVELANRKASFFEFHGTNGEDPAAPFNPRRRNKRVTTAREAKLDIVPGPKSIAGATQGPERFDVAVPGIPITYLGELQTDSQGRLIVLGGRGAAAASATLAAAGGIPHPAPLNEYANNPTWFDDISDGPVTAEIELSNGDVIPADEVEPAWVLVGPPDFAPGIRNVVSLYDTLVDLWVRTGTLDVSGASGAPLWMRDMRADFQPTTGFKDFRPDFVRDIYPLLQAVKNMRWVHGPAQAFHHWWDWAKLADSAAASAPYRKMIFDRLRVPAALTGLPAGPASASMPRLIGDEQIDENSRPPRDEDGNPDAAAPRRPASAQPGPKSWLTLTPVQYSILRQWMLGKFDKPGWPGSNKPADLPAPPKTVTPFGLDASALEGCVGGAFYPGIEVSWLVRNPRLYESKGQTSIFRVNPWQHRASGKVILAAKKPVLRKIHYGPAAAPGVDLPVQAGFFSQQMALPWQADFLSCLKSAHDGVADAGWWPAQRPDDVHVTAQALPLGPAEIAAFNASQTVHRWLGSTVAAAATATTRAVPARDGSIATRERLIAHFQKLGIVRAADAAPGDSMPNRDTVYVEIERDAIPP